MNYKNYIIIFFFLYSCTTSNTETKKDLEIISKIDSFSNKGFALLYSQKLKKEKKISKKIENRSLIIFQKKLKKDSDVKITNLLNNKSILAKVGSNANYPSFYNSVLSPRIFKFLEIDEREPYVEIYEISENSIFLAKKAKTFDEEKNVADKAPVEGISINDLSIEKKDESKKDKINNFKYIIKIADFYYKSTAMMMKIRIKNESNIKNVKIYKISGTSYRVYLGPFKDLKSLKKAFNDMSIMNFENLEIIKQ
jgi:hypothetical protein